jgi:hypothetical protein
MKTLFLIALLSAPLCAEEKPYFVQCSVKVTYRSTGRSYVRKSKTFAAPKENRRESWERCIDDLVNENNFTKEELAVESGEVREPVQVNHKQEEKQ